MSSPLISTGTGWNVFIRRNADLERVALIEDYRSLEVTAKYNDVGSFMLTMDARQSVSLLLAEPGAYGLYVVHEDTGHVLLSGPITKTEVKRAEDQFTMEISGPDDNIWLKRRVGHPVPTDPTPPYDAQTHDHREGQCSTVLIDYVNFNLGPGAIPARRVPGLVMGPDPLIGKDVKADMRWNSPLLDSLWALSIAGLVKPEEQDEDEQEQQNPDVLSNPDATPMDLEVGFRLVQQEDSLVFQVYRPENRTTTVRFSEEFGNLLSYSYSVEAPEVNYVYVGGQGEGTARQIYEKGDSASVDTWGRIETFSDRRDTSDQATLAQKADEVLGEGKAKTSLTLEPIDTEYQRFGVHYFLGDQVTVLLTPMEFNIDGATAIQETVREVKITLSDEERFPRFKATVGDTGATADVSKLFKAFRNLRARTNDLERNV